MKSECLKSRVTCYNNKNNYLDYIKGWLELYETLIKIFIGIYLKSHLGKYYAVVKTQGADVSLILH